ncbi:Aldose 1-epimerase [compost metagenome]
MLTLETPAARVHILLKGAELCSLYHKETQTEYMWEGNPAFWNKHSPILFPIVGTLKNDTFLHNGLLYSLPRHGFARDMYFITDQHAADQVTLSLRANEETLAKYPFLFALKVHYKLTDDNLAVHYSVENTGNDNMYFSIGGHPAFKIPINDTLQFEDYELQFEQTEQADIYPLNLDGQLLQQGIPFLQNTATVPLKKDLFYNDALIFKQLNSKKVRLASSKDKRYIEVSFEQFPYLGIWSKKDADFICIEPWNGITDIENASGLLAEKEGICMLKPQQKWEGSWQVQFG